MDNINWQKQDYLTKSSRNAHLIDDDLDTEDPIVSAFIEKGNDAVLTITNLNLGEFMLMLKKKFKLLGEAQRQKFLPKAVCFLL